MWGGETDVCVTPPQLPHTRHKQRCCTQLQNRGMTALTQCHAGTAWRCCPSPGGNPGGLASHCSCCLLRPALHGVHLGRELGVAVDGHLIMMKQYTQARSTTQLMRRQRSLLPTRHTCMQRPGQPTTSPRPPTPLDVDSYLSGPPSEGRAERLGKVRLEQLPLLGLVEERHH